jgi:PAS domain S-box-containing protein
MQKDESGLSDAQKKALPVVDNESERIKALKSYNILDTLYEEEFDRITELASLICETPISLISLIDENRQWFKSKVGLDVPETHRDISFCQYAIADQSIFEVEDATKDERFKNNPLVTGKPDIRFYAGQPLIDPSGQALGTLCVIDTKPKKLKPSQQRALAILANEIVLQVVTRKERADLKNFESIFKASSDLICVVGKDGRFVKTNPAFDSSLGWGNEELLTLPFLDFVHPDDRADTSVEMEKSTHFANRVKTNEGHYRLFEWATSRDEATGELYAIARDVTGQRDSDNKLRQQNDMLLATEEELTQNLEELKTTQDELERQYSNIQTSEAQFRLLSENIPGLFWVRDVAGSILYASPSWKKLLGEQPAIGAHYSVLLKAIHPDDLPMVKKASLESAENGFDFEIRSISFDKQEGWYHLRAFAVKDEKGTIYRVVGFGQDITERKKFEESLRTAREQADASNKSKSDFLANMSHEIRTPLNAVIGFTELLMKTDLGDTQLKYMSTVHQSANSLLDVINDILDFSKIEAGKLELHTIETDLLEMLNQTTGVIVHETGKKNLRMLLNTDSNLPRFILADSVRLRQVLTNLLGNAVKFTAQGEIELIVEKLSEIDEGEIALRFSVRDTGIGISLNNQSKIFEAFSQEDPSITKKYGGTGLGLAISNKLLALMGSELQVRSTVGKGSTFFFEVSFKVPVGNAAPHAKQVGISGLSGKQKSNATILIAEDNSVNMLLAKIFLERLLPEATLVEACNGNEAIEQFKNTNPDMIFMDVQMPELNGYGATAAIRKIERNGRVPIIALTAVTVKGEKEKCIEMGMDDYVTKPVSEETLDRIVAKWLPDKPAVEKKEVASVVPDLKMHFDAAALKKRSNLREEQINKLLVICQVDIKQCLADMYESVAERNLKAIKEAGHKLKGLSFSLCFERLARQAEQMEALEIFDQTSITQLINEIEVEVKEVVKVIRRTDFSKL